MSKIHPTSLIDPAAKLAPGVEVGPFCVIQGPVTLGEGTRLLSHVVIQGQVTIGKKNVIYPQTCIGFEPQDRKFKQQTAGVTIGDGNVLREGVTIHCATGMDHPTTLGNENYLMTNAHVAHDAILGSRNTLATAALIGGHVELKDDVNLGGMGSVHQECRVGRYSFIGGISGITMDLLPFTVATGISQVTGVNVVGLRRAGFSRVAIDRIKLAFRTIYLARHSNPVVIKLLAQDSESGGEGAELVEEMANFIKNTKRGILPHAKIASSHALRR